MSHIVSMRYHKWFKVVEGQPEVVEWLYGADSAIKWEGGMLKNENIELGWVEFHFEELQDAIYFKLMIR